MNGIAYLGFYRNTKVNVKNISLEDCSNGYKLVKCFECLGSGTWSFLDYIDPEPCVVCKGTGKIYINV